MKLQAEPDHRGLRLDVFILQRMPALTRSQIHKLNESGAVCVDGRREKAGYRMRGTEAVEIDLQPLAPSPLEPQHIPLQIYYEDDDLAVIEKPAGLAVHPGAGGGGSTIVHGLLFHFAALSRAGGPGRPGIVHRLDKNTSGLLIVAKNDWAHARLSQAFQDRQVVKKYLALVHGKLPRSCGEITLPIGRHKTIRSRMAAVPSDRGRPAHTAYRVVEEIGEFSLLELQIRTGRTHQIRVHLSAIGHPVVGDEVYGERRFSGFVRRYGDPGRNFLHAAELEFTHPRSGSPLKFQSPLPDDLLRLLAHIK